jgi:hypothetical protein
MSRRPSLCHGQLSCGGRVLRHGRLRAAGPIWAVPVFIAVLGSKARARRGGFPAIHAARPAAVLVGTLAVAAMATRNAVGELAPLGSPSTAVMTTNTAVHG